MIKKILFIIVKKRERSEQPFPKLTAEAFCCEIMIEKIFGKVNNIKKINIEHFREMKSRMVCKTKNALVKEYVLL